jgi:hypothetical protein
MKCDMYNPQNSKILPVMNKYSNATTDSIIHILKMHQLK